MAATSRKETTNLGIFAMYFDMGLAVIPRPQAETPTLPPPRSGGGGPKGRRGLASLGLTSCGCASFDSTLGLELHDLVPQAGILLLVGGPDLLLRHLFEGIDVGLDDHHALGFELLLGRGEIVDR